jgi:uncharacterized membrane protein YjdF
MFIKKNYFIILFSIVFFHLVGVFFLYQPFPNYDIFMHVGTGLVLSIIIHDLLKEFIKPRILKYFLVVCVLVFLGVIWELGEYVWDQTISTYFNQTVLQLSIRDTMGDLLMNMMGSLVFVLIHFYKKLDK